MKKTILLFSLLAICCVSAAQSSVLKSRYHSIQATGIYELGSFMFYEPNGLSSEYACFGGNLGYGFQFRLGTSRFYLETGVAFGYENSIKVGRGWYESDLFNAKVPLLAEYMIPMGDRFVLYPSFGVGLLLGYEKHYGSVKDSIPIVGGTIPEVGINAMIGERFIIGANYSFILSTAYFAGISNACLKVGYVF